MDIRLAGKQDIDGIIALLYQVHRVHSDGRSDLFKPGGIKYTPEDLQEKMDRSDEMIFVAVEEDRVLGYMFGVIEITPETTSLYGKKTLYIDDLCVDEKARGQHVGKALFDYTRDYAIKEGYDHVTLHVWECNPGARAFYDAMGLKPMYTAMEMIL